MSDLVLDASLALQWFLTDKADRAYSLNILNSLSNKRGTVPTLFFYEVGKVSLWRAGASELRSIKFTVSSSD